MVSKYWAAVFAVSIGPFAISASADVFNRGSGQTSLEFVSVANPDNVADATGYGAVGHTYRVGKFEVTAGQYTEFLNAVAGVDTNGLYNTLMWSGSSYGCKIERYAGSGSVGAPYRYRVADDWANRPVNFVSFWDAARFANWLHNDQPSGAQGPRTTEDGAYVNIGDQDTFARQPDATHFIPTEDEWYKAAYHKNDGITGNYFAYPTSSDITPSNDLVDPDPGNNATIHVSNATIGRPYFRTLVGAHENSESPYGTFDQGGNVWEWNEAAAGPRRRIRGGSFYADNVLAMHAESRTLTMPTTESFGIGFRVACVAAVPEPTSRPKAE